MTPNLHHPALGSCHSTNESPNLSKRKKSYKTKGGGDGRNSAIRVLLLSHKLGLSVDPTRQMGL